MKVYDHRLTPARPDLAAEHLRDTIVAPRYAKGVPQIVFDGSADLRRAPVPDAPLETEALHGEIFTVYDRDEEGWSWGQLARDGYVGFMPSKSLTADIAEPTHRVAVLRSFLYGGPSIKLPPMASLSLGSRVSIVGRKDALSITHRGHYIFSDHLVPIADIEPDFVAVSERFMGVPYYWGGKTSLGLDCSGLVQVSLGAAGIEVLRDTDMQEKSVGEPLSLNADLKRGDLIFWKGHVGIMRDSHELLHASGHQMLVVSEPLKTTVDRIEAKGGGPITSIRRLPKLSA
jgi:cell wall-associated NlpC family hydrolase